MAEIQWNPNEFPLDAKVAGIDTISSDPVEGKARIVENENGRLLIEVAELAIFNLLILNVDK